MACAFCPACLTIWSSLLSAVGVQVGGLAGERMHEVLLSLSVLLAMGVAGWKAWQQRSIVSLVLPAAGCALLVAAHALDRGERFEWSGVCLLVASSLFEHFRHRRLHRLGIHH